MANPNLSRRGRFPFSNHDRRRGDSNPNEYRMKIEIPSFNENLDIKSFLNWVYEVEKFLEMAYVPKEKHVKFMTYKLTEEQRMVRPNTNHKETPRQATRDNLETHETTPTR